MQSTIARADRRCGGRRWNVMWPAILIVEGRGFDCTILDLSQTGARIDVYGLRCGPVRASLQCERFGTLDAHLKWVRAGKAGLRFERSPAEVVDLLKTVVPGMGRRETPRSARSTRSTFGRRRLPEAA